MKATLETNMGPITIELMRDDAPQTVANFEKLARAGFYDGTKFHRVIAGFMIQGGDPQSKDEALAARWGTGGPGYTFADEIHANNRNAIGTISMANAGPNTNGSQFFINMADNNFLDGKHTVFGKVISGMENVKKIETTQTGANDRPDSPMVIERITIEWGVADTAPVTVKRSRRARSVRLSVKPGGEVILVAPISASERILVAFLSKHAAWIERSVARMRELRPLPVSGRRDYVANREAARVFVTERVREWSARLGYPHGRIAIKDTARSWGSCSHRGNLNFSYKLLFLPPSLADYVVVHELCHVKEANHSPRFWALVAAALPDHRDRRRELRRYVLR
jgi:peptidylprolyl isomerase